MTHVLRAQTRSVVWPLISGDLWLLEGRGDCQQQFVLINANSSGPLWRQALPTGYNKDKADTRARSRGGYRGRGELLISRVLASGRDPTDRPGIGPRG